MGYLVSLSACSYSALSLERERGLSHSHRSFGAIADSLHPRVSTFSLSLFPPSLLRYHSSSGCRLAIPGQISFAVEAAKLASFALLPSPPLRFVPFVSDLSAYAASRALPLSFPLGR